MEIEQKKAATTTTEEATEKVCEGQKSPSHGQEKEMEREEEEGGTNPQTTSTQLKRQHPSE